MALADSKCSSCDVKTAAMTMDQAEAMGRQIPEWTVQEKQIERTFTFPNFIEAVRFADRVAAIAEEENHHPEMHISWGKARIELSTHKIGGLSENDFIVAAKIDRVAKRSDEAPSI